MLCSCLEAGASCSFSGLSGCAVLCSARLLGRRRTLDSQRVSRDECLSPMF